MDLLSLRMSDRNFEARVKSALKALYPTITDRNTTAAIIDKPSVVPPASMSIREMNGNNLLFIWGSRWGSRRAVGN